MRVYAFTKIALSLSIVFLVFLGISTYLKLYVTDISEEDHIYFIVGKGTSIHDIAAKLETDGMIASAYYLEKYLSLSGLDRRVQSGEFRIDAPVTIARVAEGLTKPLQREEREITLIPGWSLLQYRDYFVREGLADENTFDRLVGKPAVQAKGQVHLDIESTRVSTYLPNDVSLEGYLAPETYRIFAKESFEDTLGRLINHTETILSPLIPDIEAAGRTVHEVMTIASIVQREAPRAEDMPKIADLFWRRVDAGWGLQADSTVHYLHGKFGEVFTTAADRTSDNPWNTYRYAGLPPGPIAAPSVAAIRAAVYPEPNEYWYFLTTLDTGEVKFARTLAEHNQNVQHYLR